MTSVKCVIAQGAAAAKHLTPWYIRAKFGSGGDEMAQRYLNTREAAKYLGISKQSLANDRCERRWGLPYLRIGRKVLYDIEELDNFLRSRRIAPGEGGAAS